MHADVFISYSHRDLATAESIEQTLVAAGLGYFRDVKSIPGSAEWVEEITEAVESCHAVLVLVSEQSIAAEHVYREITVAAEAKKTFIPILLSPEIKMPPKWRFYLASHQHIVIRRTLETALPEIVAASWRAVDRSQYKEAYSHSYEFKAQDKKVVSFASDRFGLLLGSSENGQAGIENDAYVLASEPGKWFGSYASDLPKLIDGCWNVRARRLSGPDTQWFGVEFGESYPGNYYQITVNSQATVRIAMHLNNQWQDLAVRQNIRQIHPDIAEIAIRIVRKRDYLHVFLNELHALTVRDWNIRIGRLGFVVGPDLRVAFSGFQIAGNTADSLFKKALEHWYRLEVTEAKKILEQLSECDPNLRHPDCPVSVSQMLREARPDYRTTVLLVVGSSALAQLYDSSATFRLRDEINLNGTRTKCQYASVITDEALLAYPDFLRCPIISIGGPETNKLTVQLCEQLPRDPISSRHIIIQHGLTKGDRRVAIWGSAASETEDATELFIKSGLLAKYLKLIWG